jgi:branched-chain amino acid transport system permease protein
MNLAGSASAQALIRRRPIRAPWSGWQSAPVPIGIGALIAFALLADANALNQMSLWLIEAVLALSLVLVWGHGGIFSLGQTAFYGIGAYAFGVLTANYADQGWAFYAGMAGALVIAALMAAVLGYFMFYGRGRVSAINIGVITLAATLVLFQFFNNTADPSYHVGEAKIGGYNGLVGIPPVELGGMVLTERGFFILVAGLAVIAALAVAMLRRSVFGRIAAAIGSNEMRAELLGYDVRRRRLALFVLGALIAGVAGGLFAAWGGFVSPVVFALQPAVIVLIWLLVGGRKHTAGAFVGVIVVEGLTQLFGGNGGENARLYLGVVLIFIVLVAPAGLLGLLDRVERRFARRPWAGGRGSLSVDALELPSIDRSLSVATHGVGKRFSGLTAVDGVDLELPERGILCLIGPNGAGKSTLFSLLAGTERVSSGSITVDGRDITRLEAYRRARLGIGVKRQMLSLFMDLSVRENLWLAGYAATHSKASADERADRLLKGLGLDGDSEISAGALSHGHQQWLEIGMVIAQEPALILLDEPTAGMTVAEIEATADLVKRLAEHTAVVVVEHDMSFIRLLQAPVTVMHLGKVYAQGELRELERDEGILEIYLGRRHAPA